jgi:molecular chaperone GrpE
VTKNARSAGPEKSGPADGSNQAPETVLDDQVAGKPEPEPEPEVNAAKTGEVAEIPAEVVEGEVVEDACDPATAAAQEGQTEDPEDSQGQVLEGEVLEGEVVEAQVAADDEAATRPSAESGANSQASGRATGTAKVTGMAKVPASSRAQAPTSGSATVQPAPVTEPAQEQESAPAEAAEQPAAGDANLQEELAERTADLLRVMAEYSNYRKRVERDKASVTEQATGAVLLALLPILDDLDRAREHGDLVGPFATMAEQLNTTVAKFGLVGFGTKGDAFDPARHEAVVHQPSTEVTEPTCVEVLRRGYLIGERLLRPAMVVVADSA